MTMKNNIKAMNSSTQHEGFETQWLRRRQWEEQVEKSVPDDKTFLRWAEKAQQTPANAEVKVTPFPLRRNKRWIPYAAAASIVIGVGIIGLTRSNQPNDRLPLAKEVTVESQTISFICNNGCSVQDIMLLANKVIK
jgi:hypothetical protein